MTYFESKKQFPVYHMAKFYVNHCGFSVVPAKERRIAIRGKHFYEHLPLEKHLKAWFTGQYSNIAIVPGLISGNVGVIDFDEFGAFQTWLSLVPGATAFPIVRTDRGCHVYIRLQHPEKNGKAHFQGLEVGDVVTQSGIFAPPSIHPSGAVYCWYGNPRQIPIVNRLSDIGIERIAPNQHQRKARAIDTTQATRKTFLTGITNPAAYATAALYREVETLTHTQEGNRSNALYYAAFKLARFVNVLSAERIRGELHRASLSIGIGESDARSTIQRGLTNGIRKGVIAA